MQRIYISYATGGKSEEIADTLYHLLLENGYEPKLDKRDLAYKADLLAYEKAIGAGDYIITIISDKYLKSGHCMNEMLFIHQKGNIIKRIFPIVTGDARGIDTPEGRLDYETFWDNKIEDFEPKLTKRGIKPGSEVSVSDNTRLHDIRRIIGNILNILAWMNTRVVSTGENKDFTNLLKVLERQIETDTCSIPPLSPVDHFIPSNQVRIKVPGRPYIIGRDEQLKELHQRISTEQPLLLVNGLGGIGKTTLAQEYVNHPAYSQSYHYIAWITVEKDIKQAIITGMHRPLGIDLRAYPLPKEQFEIVADCMQNMPGKHLLVLDNANNREELINNHQPLTSLHWHILITSRSETDDMEILNVDELPPEDACRLFLHHFKKTEHELIDDEAAVLKDLLSHIHYHTLLTELLAKAGHKKGLKIKAIFDCLKEADIKHKAFRRTISFGSHAEQGKKGKEGVLYDYILALFEPETLDGECKQYLRFFALMPSQEIPLPHVKTLCAIKEEDENRFEDVLAGLAAGGWITLNNCSCKMHPLIRDVTGEKLNPNPVNCSLIISTLSRIMQESATVAFDYLVYARAVTERIINPDESIALLLIYFSDACRAIGNIQQALESMEQAHILFKQSGNTYNLSVTYERLGEIQQALGQFDKALHFFELDADLTKELYEANPKSVELVNGMAVSYYKIGALYKEMNEGEKGNGYLEKALVLWEELYALTKLEQYNGYIELVKGMMG